MADIVVTGASGMLGRALMKELAAYSPAGTAWKRARNQLVPLNLLDFDAVTAFIRKQSPRVILHTAAERSPDVSEKDPEGTRAINVGATTHLAKLAKKLGAWMLYLSTDYVFDGTHPPYRPDDKPNPLNSYGKTKLEGEHAVFEQTSDGAVLRVGVLFGRVEFPDESAVTTLVKQVRGQQPAAVDDWGRRYPTYVDDVASVCAQLMKYRREQSELRGIFHWGGDEQYTKYQQAVLIGELLGVPTSHLRPDPNPPAGAPRPHDCRLDCSSVTNIVAGRRTPFRNAIETVLKEGNL